MSQKELWTELWKELWTELWILARLQLCQASRSHSFPYMICWFQQVMSLNSARGKTFAIPPPTHRSQNVDVISRVSSQGD